MDNGGSIVFTPIFKESSDKINAVFVYSDFGADENSYIMMTREEMVVIASDPKNPNFHLLNKIYKEFDSDLFALDLPQYDDWAELVLAVDDACYNWIGFASDGLNDFSYVVCSSGCTNDLLNSGIVDENEEIAWVRGNCTKAAVIDAFLQNNGSLNSDVISAAEVILETTILGELSRFELTAIIENIGPELIFLLGEGVLSDACESTISSREMTSLVMNTPSIWTYSVNDFYSDLGEQFDYIVKKHFEHCLKMECVLDKLLETGLCSDIANSFEELEGDFDLIYQYDYNCMSHPFLSDDLNYGPDCEFSGQQSNYASTRPSPGCFEDEDGSIVCEPFTIQLYNKHFCDNLSPLEMAAYYLHETIHSEFHRWVYEGASGNITSTTQFSANGLLWSAIVLDKYGSDDMTNHHALMNEYLVPEMTDILWTINGETDVANKINYQYFVYDLLLSDDLLISMGYLTQTDLDNLKDLSSQVVSNVGCE